MKNTSLEPAKENNNKKRARMQSNLICAGSNAHARKQNGVKSYLRYREPPTSNLGWKLRDSPAKALLFIAQAKSAWVDLLSEEPKNYVDLINSDELKLTQFCNDPD